MKYFNKATLGLVALATALGFWACQDDFDGREPSFVAPVAEHEANMTLLELREMYWSNEKNYCDTIGYIYNDVDDITGETALYPRNADGSRKKLAEDIYIKGRVISNDYDGNVFKKLMIQDETSAICFSIDSYNLYLNYRQGQEIVFKATGLYFGAFNGQHVIGVPQYYDTQKVWETGRMPLEYFRQRVELNGFPEPSKMDTVVMEVSAVPAGSEYNGPENQLVRFNNVYFPDANGKTQLGRYEESSTIHKIMSADGTASIDLDTSGYSTFWYETLPEGNGDVVGILVYSDSKGFQLQLIDFNGLMNFGNPTLPKGQSWETAYSVDEVIEFENKDVTGAAGWMTGYIVGAVGPDVEDHISGNSDIEWSADATLAFTVVLAPAPEIKDIASCVVVPLPQGSKMRELANLVDHPENYGKQMWVNGSFTRYMDAWGVIGSGDTGAFLLEGMEAPDTPVEDGDGSKEKPFNIAQALAAYNSGVTDMVWVEAYIVGSVADGAMKYEDVVFGTANASGTNIVIGPEATCTDASICMPVALVAGGKARTDLNLKSHQGNLGRKVKLYGTLEKYFGQPGLKNVAEYEWADGGSTTPDDPGTNPPAGSGDGTASKPYSVAQVFTVYNAGGTTTPVWVECYIIGSVAQGAMNWSDAVIGTANASTTNIIVADSPTATDLSKCIPVALASGGKARTDLNLSANPGMLGKKVYLCGTIEKYFGQPGLKNVKDYTLTPGSDDPDTPGSGAGTIYTGLTSSFDGWTIENVTLPSGADYVWNWKEYNGSWYLNGSGYFNSKANNAEAYAYTTVDFKGYSTVTATFEHAAKFQTTLRDLCGMVVRETGTSAWTKVTIPSWPEAGTWTFAGSGNVDLSSFAGKKVDVGFLYKSSTAGADTWEIKNLVITGK